MGSIPMVLRWRFVWEFLEEQCLCEDFQGNSNCASVGTSLGTSMVLPRNFLGSSIEAPHYGSTASSISTGIPWGLPCCLSHGDSMGLPWCFRGTCMYIYKALPHVFPWGASMVSPCSSSSTSTGSLWSFQWSFHGASSIKWPFKQP